MQVTDFPINWGFHPSQARQPATSAPPASPTGQGLADPARTADERPAPPRPASPLPVNSLLDALLNGQTPSGRLVFGEDGKPDLHATLLANLPPRGLANGVPGAIGGVKVISHSDDGSSDAASLAGLSSQDVAQDLIRQAGTNGSLSFNDVLRTMGIDPSTDTGESMASSVKLLWDKLAHGQAGALSASQVADAVSAYRNAQGDDIPAGGAAWTG